MRYNLKIFYLLLTMVYFCFSLYTVFMHFKYYSTQNDLFNNRYKVVLQDLYKTIDRSRKQLNIGLAEIKNISSILKKIKESNPEIINLHVFEFQKREIAIVHSTSQNPLADNTAQTKNLIFATASRQTKDPWSFDLNKHNRYLGLNMLNTVGTAEAGFVLHINPTAKEDAVDNEVTNLYKRLLIAIIAVTPFLLLITSTSLAGFNQALAVIEKNLQNLKDDPDNYKSTIHEVKNIELRYIFKSTLKKLQTTVQKLNKLEELIRRIKF